MSMGATMTFHLPEGWTVRKVAGALAREWLSPFRAEPAFKAARWVVQSIVETSDGAESGLWEPGISTAEYEERLDRPDLCWAIRASAGRSKPTILARLALSKDRPDTFEMVCCQASFPDTLFDSGKVGEFLGARDTSGVEGLFTALVTSHGFQPAAV